MDSSEAVLSAKAKKLLALSMEKGHVSQERVSAVLEALRKSPPSQYKGLLKQYLKHVERALAAQEAIVEHAGSFDKKAKSLVEAELEKHYGQKMPIKSVENKDLIAGLRIRVGDDVWDRSVANSLETLAQSF